MNEGGLREWGIFRERENPRKRRQGKIVEKLEKRNEIINKSLRKEREKKKVESFVEIVNPRPCLVLLKKKFSNILKESG